MKRLAALGALPLALFYAGDSTAQTRSTLNGFNNSFITANGNKLITGSLLNALQNLIINGTALLNDTNTFNYTSPTNLAIGGVVGALETYTNASGVPQQGKKLGYFSNAGTGAGGGFDLGNTQIAIWTTTSFSGSLVGLETAWTVGISPTINGAAWSMAVQEWNAVNRGADHGYTIGTGGSNAVTGLLVVPEGKNFGQGGATYNGDIAFVSSQSGSIDPVSNLHNQWYHGFMCAQNSEAAAFGRCFSALGEHTSTPALNPASPLSVYYAWNDGIDTASASFLYGMAVRAGAGQGIGISDGGAIDASVTPGGGGAGYGANLTGTLTWAGTGHSLCGANPVLNVTTDGTGAIATMNSVTVAGSCVELPTPYAKTWTPGGGLSAGSGAQMTLTYDFAGINSVGAGSSLGVVVSATGKQFFVNFPSFNVIAATATNTQITAFSGDIVIGLGSANVTSATHTFLSPPFTNGTPTGVPAQNTIPNMQWNDTTGTINVWSPHTATWLHVTLSPAAG